MCRIRRIGSSRTRRRSFGECGERLGGLDVFLVALLIALELLLLDGSEAGAQTAATSCPCARSISSCTCAAFSAVLGIVSALPREPVGGPPRVRRLQLLLREWKRSARGRVEILERVRKQLPARLAREDARRRSCFGSCWAAAAAAQRSRGAAEASPRDAGAAARRRCATAQRPALRRRASAIMRSISGRCRQSRSESSSGR